MQAFGIGGTPLRWGAAVESVGELAEGSVTALANRRDDLAHDIDGLVAVDDRARQTAGEVSRRDAGQVQSVEHRIKVQAPAGVRGADSAAQTERTARFRRRVAVRSARSTSYSSWDTSSRESDSYDFAASSTRRVMSSSCVPTDESSATD